jgi:hypothetical protein
VKLDGFGSASEERRRSHPRYPPTLWLGILGSAAFFLLVALRSHTPVLALFGLLYLMTFLDRHGDLGCAVGALGLVAALVLCWYSLLLLGPGAGHGLRVAEVGAAVALVGFFLCQCCMVHGAWRYARKANSETGRHDRRLSG